MFLFFFITSVLVIFDQLIKYICVVKLMPIYSVEVIKNFFYLTYVENRGAAFGIFEGARIFLIIVTILVISFCIYKYKQLLHRNQRIYFWYRMSALLITAGSIANLIDRVFRGYVVDMLHFMFFGKNFAVFNFADIYVVIGTIIFFVCTIVSEYGIPLKKDVK